MMSFNKSLVIVVGAGASNEVGLPLGTELKDTISAGLKYSYNMGQRLPGGSDLVMSAIEYLAYHQTGAKRDFNEYIMACRTICEAIPQALSIDNLVDAHKGDERLEMCAKISIAESILAAERRSQLYTNNKPNSKLYYSNIQGTWYGRLWDLIAAGSRADTVAERLSKMAIITFNYDRCIEHFLHSSLQNFFRVSPQQATALLDNLTVHHAYGQLGPLPWTQRTDAVSFGDEADSNRLVGVAKTLKTFTEGTDENESHVRDIRRYMHYADRIAFLGFAYDRQNLQLLYGNSGAYKKTNSTVVYGTAYGVSDSNRKAIKQALQIFGGYAPDEIELVPDVKCAKLLQDFSWSLSLTAVGDTA